MDSSWKFSQEMIKEDSPRGGTRSSGGRLVTRCEAEAGREGPRTGSEADAGATPSHTPSVSLTASSSG